MADYPAKTLILDRMPDNYIGKMKEHSYQLTRSELKRFHRIMDQALFGFIALYSDSTIDFAKAGEEFAVFLTQYPDAIDQLIKPGLGQGDKRILNEIKHLYLDTFFVLGREPEGYVLGNQSGAFFLVKAHVDPLEELYIENLGYVPSKLYPFIVRTSLIPIKQKITSTGNYAFIMRSVPDEIANHLLTRYQEAKENNKVYTTSEIFYQFHQEKKAHPDWDLQITLEGVQRMDHS